MFNGNAVWKLNLIESTAQKVIGSSRKIANSSIPLICIRKGFEWSHKFYTQL